MNEWRHIISGSGIGNALFDIFALAWGACIGSFVNVCIYRIPADESIVAPRSHCTHCNRLIAWYDNIPLLSILLLRARCRQCGTRISPRYFVVELLVALLFLLVWREYGITPRTPVYWLFVAGLTVGTFIDFDHMIIPDRITLGGIGAGFLLSGLIPALHATPQQPDPTVWAALGSSALGLLCGAGTLLLVAQIGKLIFRKDAMGMGDVKLLGAIGAFLGWQAVFWTVVVSSFAGSLVGISLVIARRKGMQGRIPYGPYLALAAVLWILGGARLWYGYWTWLRGGF